jgi:hypothetical protein
VNQREQRPGAQYAPLRTTSPPIIARAWLPFPVAECVRDRHRPASPRSELASPTNTSTTVERVSVGVEPAAGRAVGRQAIHHYSYLRGSAENISRSSLACLSSPGLIRPRSRTARAIAHNPVREPRKLYRGDHPKRGVGDRGRISRSDWRPGSCAARGAGDYCRCGNAECMGECAHTYVTRGRHVPIRTGSTEHLRVRLPLDRALRRRVARVC